MSASLSLERQFHLSVLMLASMLAVSGSALADKNKSTNLDGAIASHPMDRSAKTSALR
jgi:hypothetical protein